MRGWLACGDRSASRDYACASALHGVRSLDRTSLSRPHLGRVDAENRESDRSCLQGDGRGSCRRRRPGRLPLVLSRIASRRAKLPQLERVLALSDVPRGTRPSQADSRSVAAVLFALPELDLMIGRSRGKDEHARDVGLMSWLYNRPTEGTLDTSRRSSASGPRSRRRTRPPSRRATPTARPRRTSRSATRSRRPR